MRKLFFLLIFCVLFFLPASSRGAVGVPEYRIFPRDILEIRVYDNPDLTQRLEVSESGEISFPLIGKIKVSSLTAPEAEQALGKSLSEYIVNPQVAVLVAQRQNIYVSGEVKKPGAYELTAGMTVFEAITLAGGFTDFAAPNKTSVRRTKGDKKEVIAVPIAEILKRGDKKKDITLEPGDVIVVPETFF
jgi:protein involved in polysaccharide export with SLBB domain